MTQHTVYPLTFVPIFKDYPWGGRNLAEKLGRAIPDGIVAESWEIAAHANGESRVANGASAGQTLRAMQEKWGLALVGRRNVEALAQQRFPLLIKLLDANRWLSVQVHPDDRYAADHASDLGKTEMWVVLHAEENAEVIFGFAPGVDQDTFATAIETDDVARYLHRIPVSTDDVVFVPAGAIHSLGPGLIVAEIQQNSDTTYRVYDWGRDRPIHIQQALDVLNFDLIAPTLEPPLPVPDRPAPTELIGECPYFRTERIRLDANQEYSGRCDGETFEIWGLLSGQIQLNWPGTPVDLAAIDWVLLPAMLGGFTIKANRPSTLLRVITPEPQA